jgi:beta-N-acetylhexosaminidase
MLCKVEVNHLQIQKSNVLMFKKVLIGLTSFLLSFSALSQDAKSRWVDSVFQTMSPEEKVGQLFMLSVSPYGTEDEKEEWIDKVKSYYPGGIIITHSGPVSHIQLVNQFQSLSKIPMLVGLNAEWGVGQTIDSVKIQSQPLLMGALPDSLVTVIGREIALEMKAFGAHINFAPNMAVNRKEEKYPSSLSYFSDSKSKVIDKSIAFFKGLIGENILVCAKYFSGEDSNETLVSSKKKKKKKNAELDTTVNFINHLDTSILYSYQRMARAGLSGFLTTNLPLFSINKQDPSALLSQLFVSDVLRKKTGFSGLTFANIPFLQRISGKNRGGETELLAFKTGNDILIDPKYMGASIKKILKEFQKNPKLEDQLNATVKKILSAKYDVGLNAYQPIDLSPVSKRAKSIELQLLKHKIAEATVTVVKNTADLIPIKSIKETHFASLVIGKEQQNTFNSYLDKYADFEKFTVRMLQDTVGLRVALEKQDVIVVSLFPLASSFEWGIVPLIRKLSGSKRIILCHFGDPYALQNYTEANTIIAAYTDDDLIQKATAQIIFGGMKSKGTLPVVPSPYFTEGSSVYTNLYDRFTYTLPEAAGLDSKTLAQIEPIAREAIDIGSTPGCYVFVARNGKVIYDRSFGWFTYDNKTPVTTETIYDLASVTKVSATLQTVMFMYEKGLIDVNKKASYYLPELKASNKKDFTIKDILAHQSGLWPFLPFWASTTTGVTKESAMLPFYYNKMQSQEYPFPVADSLFAFNHMKDSLWQWIIKSRIIDKTERTPYDYRYSDMGFYIMHHLAEKLLNQPMEDFLEQNLYEPMGAYTTGFLPRKKFPANRIAPTENDVLFRKRLLIGYVHDQGAAMHGGVAGHAGLFSTANDLGKLGQMWLNKGHYGNVQFFKPETVDFFTAKQFERSRRGLGWDKPLQSDPNGPTSLYSSPQTFGHTGFTGTSIWVDPQFNLVFIFLSNRVYPEMTNNKILNANIRPRIQDVVYKAIFNYCAINP